MRWTSSPCFEVAIFIVLFSISYLYLFLDCPAFLGLALLFQFGKQMRFNYIEECPKEEQ